MWEWDRSPPPPPPISPLLPPHPCTPSSPKLLCFSFFSRISPLLPIQGAPSPLWLEALDNTVILYLSLAGTLMSTHACIFNQHLFTQSAWLRIKELINFKSLPRSRTVTGAENTALPPRVRLNVKILQRNYFLFFFILFFLKNCFGILRHSHFLLIIYFHV